MARYWCHLRDMGPPARSHSRRPTGMHFANLQRCSCKYWIPALRQAQGKLFAGMTGVRKGRWETHARGLEAHGRPVLHNFLGYPTGQSLSRAFWEEWGKSYSGPTFPMVQTFKYRLTEGVPASSPSECRQLTGGLRPAPNCQRLGCRARRWPRAWS